MTIRARINYFFIRAVLVCPIYCSHSTTMRDEVLGLIISKLLGEVSAFPFLDATRLTIEKMITDLQSFNYAYRTSIGAEYIERPLSYVLYNEAVSRRKKCSECGHEVALRVAKDSEAKGDLPDGPMKSTDFTESRAQGASDSAKL